jgi:pimeloyl-ACP methyl ester carboxylesterase
VRLWYVYFFQLPWLPERVMRAFGYGLMRAELAGVLTPEESARHVEAMARPGAMHAAIQYYRAAFRDYLRGRRPARRIDVPVLILWGLRDLHIPPYLAAPPPALVPQLRLEWLDATHWLQSEVPDAVNAQLRAFVGATS